MLIDHLIYAHPDLDTAVNAVHRRFGVEAGGGGRHPGRGTHNKLLGLGPRTYLELIAPDPGQPAPAMPRPDGVEGITRGGLVGWAIAVEDIEAARMYARSHGFDPGPVMDGHRQDAAGRLLHWRVTGNAQVGGLIPFLISWGETRHPAADAPGGLTLRSLSIGHPRPTEIETALAALCADVESTRHRNPLSWLRWEAYVAWSPREGVLFDVGAGWSVWHKFAGRCVEYSAGEVCVNEYERGYRKGYQENGQLVVKPVAGQWIEPRWVRVGRVADGKTVSTTKDLCDPSCTKRRTNFSSSIVAPVTGGSDERFASASWVLPSGAVKSMRVADPD